MTQKLNNNIELNKSKISEKIEMIKNGEQPKKSLKEVLGGKKLDEIFDSFTQNALFDNLINSGKIHTLMEHGNGLDILDGLLNNHITGDLSNFYIIKSDYILNLPPEEQKNMAISISGGMKDLAEALQNAWKNGIRTEACTTREEDNKPMIQFRIKEDEFDIQDMIQHLYGKQDIKGKTIYDNEDKSFQVNLKGDNLYKYLKGNMISEFDDKENIFIQAIKESLEFNEEMFEYYSKNGMDITEVSQTISEEKESLLKLEKRNEYEKKNKSNSKKLIGIQELGKQVIVEMSDTVLMDETEKNINEIEKNVEIKEEQEEL